MAKQKTRKQLVEDLAETQGRVSQLEALVASIRDYIVQLDLDGRILFANRALGRGAPDDVVGTSIFDWMLDDSEATLRSALERVVETGVGEVVDCMIRDPRGNHLSHSASIVAIKDNGEVRSTAMVIRDVTGLTMSRDQLKAETDNLRKYFECLPIMAYKIDPNGTITDCNEAVLQTLGYESRDDLAGKSLIDTIYAPSSREKAGALFARWKREGRLRNEELQVITREGEVLDVLLNVVTILDRNGDPVHSLSTQMEATERKRSHMAVRMERDNLLIVLGAMGAGVVIVDEGYNIVYVNSFIDRIYGPWKGRKCHDYFDNAGGVCTNCPGPGVFKGEVPRRDWKCPRNGRYYELVDTEISSLDENRHRIEVFWDITERKHTEEELARSEEKYRNVVAASTDAIVVYNVSTGRVLETNPAAETLYGYSKEEFQNLTLNDLTAEPDATNATIRDGIENEIVRIPRRYHRRKDGSVFAVEISAGAFVQEGRSILVEIVRDITDRLAADHVLKEERDRAEMYLDIANVILLALDEDGRVIMINRKGREVLGCEQDDIIGKVWFDHFLPERLRSEVKDVFHKVLACELGDTEYHENAIVTSGGEERIVAWRGRVIKDNSGRAIGILSSGEDITDRQESDREIMRLSTAMRVSSESIVLSDLDGTITDANNAAMTMCG
ncbi:MAG: PAS domain S-box protein, partial [Candidatus Eisenbacteria bacterium]